MPANPPCRTSSRPSRRPRRTAGLCLAGLLAALPGAAGAAEQAYTLDPVHTRVLLAIEHAGLSQALGTVSGSDGILLFDPDDWSRARLEVRVPLARLDFGDPRWNAAVLAGNLLDAEDHPEARFVSTAVTPCDASHARVCGELTLRGVTGPLCLDVTLNALKRYPLPPFRRTAGFSATATLSRRAFGIDAWPSLIGDQVSLRIEAEAVRAPDSVADRLAPAPATAAPAGVPPSATPAPEADASAAPLPPPDSPPAPDSQKPPDSPPSP